MMRLEPIEILLREYRREQVLHLVRVELERARSGIANGKPSPSEEQLAERVVTLAHARWTVRPRGLINATGVILHTNAGRAPLSEAALSAMQEAATYSDLELDMSSGGRGSRQDNVRYQITDLTGAEDAYVTVNAASSVLLALTELAQGREVIVSRGQSVEIGGGFRVPVILSQSGARLVEVGTTNRTRLSDYEDAINSRTAAILHVHTSNFRIEGFTESVPLPDLAVLARKHKVRLIDDNGSGALLETEAYGLRHEPTVQESVRAGSDLVAFSGDKLLGGPQAGVLCGRSEVIQALERHPLARALRPDKMIMAALSATLVAHLRDEAADTLPVWRMISQRQEDIVSRAREWAKRAAGEGLQVATIEGESTIGGGSLPGETLPTLLIRLPRFVTASLLRGGVPRVLGRTRDGHVHLDLRTVPPGQEGPLLRAVLDARQKTNREPASFPETTRQ